MVGGVLVEVGEEGTRLWVFMTLSFNIKTEEVVGVENTVVWAFDNFRVYYRRQFL